MSQNMSQKYIANTLFYALTNKYLFYTIKGMRYTKKMFDAEYPNDDACLEQVFQNRFGDLKYCPKCGAETKFYRVKKRQCYACMHCGYQLHPLAGTIFRKTTTPLKDWFYAIYLFSVSKNGVSAKELERHLGVTYKTAWRMGKQIRLLMQQEGEKLTGVVEVDETYIGGKGTRNWQKEKTGVYGVAERYGSAKAVIAQGGVNATTAIPFLKAHVEEGSKVMSDESRIYNRVKRDYTHAFVNHSNEEYVRGDIHTNTIEGFWGQLKTSIRGTYHCVSPKYLQSYVNEFVFRYNYRDVAVCPLLLERV
jgi:transposase-like protein